MSNQSIFITGANGEIGSSLIKSFNKKGINNIIALDLEQPQHNFQIKKFIKGSIEDKKLLNDINKQYSIGSFYHLAAILSTKAEHNPQLSNNVNIDGTKNILDICIEQSKKQNKIIPFFFPSSIAVYNTKNS